MARQKSDWPGCPGVPAPSFASVLWSRGFRTRYGHEGAHLGRWEWKYWPNFPGPIYSTTDNTMSCGAYSTDGPGGVILHDGNHEFLWRQPINDLELDRTMYAMSGDEVLSFQIDGNEHWTPELVRDWWSRRSELSTWLARLLHGRLLRIGDRRQNHYAVEMSTLLDYRTFLEEAAEEYLRRYIYFLAEQRLPDADSSLPEV